MTATIDETATVFVIEDEPSVRRIVRMVSESIGLSVKEFESAEEFLEAADSSIGTIGCIVADVRLRGISGVELLERLTAEGRARPMVVITGYATTETVVRAMQNGAMTVLDKPFRPQKLSKAISEAIRADQMGRTKRAQILDLQRRFSRLTDQERVVLQLIIGGASNKQISKHLDVSVRTVESRRQQIFKKTGSKNLGELMWHALWLRSSGFGCSTEVVGFDALDLTETAATRDFP